MQNEKVVSLKCLLVYIYDGIPIYNPDLELSRWDKSHWALDQRQKGEQLFCFLLRFTPIDREGSPSLLFPLLHTRRFQFPYRKISAWVAISQYPAYRVFLSHVKASAHSFKQFTSRLLKSTFSLSLCTYITRMDVMLDFICMGPVDLPGARRKRQNTKWKIPCPQWDSNPQPLDSKSDALPTELAGLGECYPFKSPYYIHVLPILMYTLL